MIFAYIDLRPILYLAGLPLAFTVAFIVARAKRWRFWDELFLLATFVGYSVLFAFVFAGPFVGRKNVETYEMTWSIAAVPPRVPSSCREEAEVTLFFVDDPGRAASICSDELAAHLRHANQSVVPATFVVIRDFWDVRSRILLEVAGLKRSSWR